ncbi:MAG: SMC-Scp complex subunit ScpB [Defluviitaleaceae bacterium]|nr:SMC-Scp complex subunit ScpB [Defluviitaleaceae bacterium]
MPGLTNERAKMLEALLFASGESVPVAKLADALAIDIPLTRILLSDMADTYEKENAGIQLREVDDCYRLCTNPSYYPAIAKLLKAKPRKVLSQTLLEILAIIAFKQPVTRSIIENIRGVNCDHGVNRLMEYGLVEERGRVMDIPGRPILLGTTEEFLLFYGLKSVEELVGTPDEGLGA